MGIYVGVDGCRAGWFAVALLDGGGHEFGLFPTIGGLWNAWKTADRVLIDIPIGLPEEGTRAADREARALLKARRSSIFSVPVRAAVYASAYAEASEINRQITGKKVSKQSWNIAPKIREVDAFVQYTPDARDKLLETHPEILFWAMNGRPMSLSKRLRGGLTERLKVLERLRPGVTDIYDEAAKQYRRTQVARDDIVDALVCAVGALSGNLATLPENVPIDARGVPMRIVYSRPPRISRLHHAQIAIPTGQEDTARQFYCNLLGLREIPKPESLAGRGGLWLELGDIQLHIGVEDGVDHSATKAHLAYQVGDIGYWRDLLTKAGYTIAESVPIPGYERCETRDPFGNRIEFIQPIVKARRGSI